nr:coiled-coil domain-containing protein 167 isoform X2 [Columba livia]XP_021145134.1 coiled-coil domain-containing protein 167 isoform X2 [Columba livia]
MINGIDGLEEKLAHCRQSMEEVDVKLRREKLSPEGRKSLERERNLLMTKADNYDSKLFPKGLPLEMAEDSAYHCHPVIPAVSHHCEHQQSRLTGCSDSSNSLTLW